MTEPALPPETLLADHAWSRRLARRLVRDAALADDLAQEACVRALQHPPLRDLRAWLGGVVRNLVRSDRRERGRRARREEVAAVREALPSAADALERMTAQQDIVGAVLALAEPYRSTIVLRFYDGLPPRRIAARLGVPVATVKTRLARGLAQLRTALDGEHGGDGRAWALFLVPLTDRGSGLVPWLAGGLAVHTALKVAFVSVAGLGALLWAVRRGAEPRAAAGEGELRSAAVELATAPFVAEEELRAIEPQREQLSAKTEPAATPVVAEEEPSPVVAGRVLDITGAPVPGVELGLRGSGGVRFSEGPAGGSILWREELPAGAPLAVSGADGTFRIGTYGGHVVSQDARWETVLAPTAYPDPDHEALLVVAPRFRLRGRVTDPAGAPLAGVEVRFDVLLERVMAPGLVYASSRMNGWSTQSDADGHFGFERLPAIPGAALNASLAPYLEHRIERADWRDDELEIVLAEPDGAWLTGRVEARGAPLAGATVALGYRATKSDEKGEFRLSLADLERADELCAAARGFLPARIEGDENEDGTVRWPDRVRLVLEGESLALAGRVLDEEGRPLAGMEVSLQDATVAWADESDFPVFLESVLAGGGPGMSHGTKTDADGSFVIEGLEERDYRLRVIDPKTALVIDAGPFAAGTRDAVITRPPDQLWARVRGTVVDRAGKPLAGAHVSIDREAGLIGVPGRVHYVMNAHGARTRTADDGSFELADVPRGGVVLHVHGEGMSDPELELDADIDPDRLRVVVGRTLFLEVHLGEVHRAATALAVLDPAGDFLELSVPTGAGSRISTAVSLSDGRSPVIGVSDDGAVLVLYRDKDELGRFPITLTSGGVNRIDL